MARLLPEHFANGKPPSEIVIAAYDAIHDLIVARASHQLVDDPAAFALAIEAVLREAAALAIDVARRAA